MLNEFAFTPSVFDEKAQEDKEAWRDQLSELASTMFPKTSAWPIVISDLYDGSWSNQILTFVNNIGDDRARIRCQKLLTNIKRQLVVRPVCKEWPGDEDAVWCREALSTHSFEPIDRIISVRKTKETSTEEFDSIRCLDEVTEGGFWHGINSDASPKMIISDQIQLLRKLCFHSQWIAFMNPYGFTSELAFTVRLTAMAMQRHKDFGNLTVELHVNMPDDPDPTERAKKQENATRNTILSVNPKITEDNAAELYFWPKILDRIIVAGDYVKQSDGVKRKRPRWGVSMSHVARKDEPNALPTEWKLLRPEAIDRWFREFIAENIPNKPVPTMIRPQQKPVSQ